MERITCDICMDLIPLVKDGIASEDSRTAVEEHIKDCPECAAAYGSSVPEPSKESQTLRKLRSRTQIGMSMLMMFGIVFGLNLTEGTDVFNNSLIMPLLGVLGYILFRWRALYLLPVLLFGTSVVSFLLGMIKGMYAGDAASLLVWTGIFCLFAIGGVVIAGLMHFAFRKEKSDEEKDS